MSSNIYKTTYISDRYGGDTTIGLTIEFIDLNKYVDGEENVTWSWDLILDEKHEVYVWSDEDNKGRKYDGGCYYTTKDEYGNKALDTPLKDPDEADQVREYIKKEWPLQKREDYIFKKKLSTSTQKTFGDIIDEL
jgi:hypothetical protein